MSYPSGSSIYWIVFELFGGKYITRGSLPSTETLKMQKTCYMCWICTGLDRNLVLMVLGQMICQMLMMKWITSIGKRILVAI